MSSSSSTNVLLRPYLDAISNTSSSSSSSTTVHRAVINKLLQDPELFYGYNIIKQYILSTSITSNVSNIDSKLMNTLDLFSYGTISDYYQQQQDTTGSSSYYLTLTEPQIIKLRQLTALSIIAQAAQNHQNIISYKSIHDATMNIHIEGNNNATNTITTTTSIPSQTIIIRETEHILSPLIASRMIVGKLSQKTMSFILGIGKQSSSTSSQPGPIGNTQGTDSSAKTTSTDNNNSANNDTTTTTGTTTNSSSGTLVIQSRDVDVQNNIPKILLSIQQLCQQMNHANQYLHQQQINVLNGITTTTTSLNQPQQQEQQVSSLLKNISSPSTFDPSTIPMDIERISMTNTTTSSDTLGVLTATPISSTTTTTTTTAKRSRS